jgi:opacity protein-like surface antigen
VLLCILYIKKEKIMKKVLILSSVLMLSAYNANAAGLYIGAGYGNSDPDFTVNVLTEASSSDSYAGYEQVVAGWPNAEKENALGWWASPWEAGLPEEWVFDTEKNKTYSFSIGWAIPRNPFRFEFEYLKSSFSASGFLMNVYPGAGGEYCSTKDCNGGEKTPTNVYTFDLGYDSGEEADLDVSSYMANVLFEIPGLGNIDPYIGYGYGISKIKGVLVGEDGPFSTKNGTTTQLIAGVEYRVSDTPLILGLEYKKLKVDNVDDDYFLNSSYTYKHDMIMFKVKYDFISDKY